MAKVSVIQRQLKREKKVATQKDEIRGKTAASKRNVHAST